MVGTSAVLIIRGAGAGAISLMDCVKLPVAVPLRRALLVLAVDPICFSLAACDSALTSSPPRARAGGIFERDER